MNPEQIEAVRRYRPLSDLMPAHWRAGVVERPDGARLGYLRTGGGKPALLLLHGVQSAGIGWLRTALALDGGASIGAGRSRVSGSDEASEPPASALASTNVEVRA